MYDCTRKGKQWPKRFKGITEDGEVDSNEKQAEIQHGFSGRATVSTDAKFPGSAKEFAMVPHGKQPN